MLDKSALRRRKAPLIPHMGRRGTGKMPFIRKIEVNGFKTFGRKTALSLDKGFTAITGPNGSGKTNIIDAVLFGLGELSARRLRATNFSSLIFHGSPNSGIRKKDKAKVIVQFDNSDGRLPTDTSTVTVSREIDQGGQSVYRINGRRVSRSYSVEVLSVAGISPHGHNVVLQGSLTRIAEISPAERRKVIEDMIGIAQYDSEKAEAEGKLESADISIKTAMGQVGEVQRRIESLERERNNLLRHNFIQDEIRRLEATRLSWETMDIQKKIGLLSSEIGKLEEEMGGLRERRENLRSRRRGIEVEWRKLGFQEAEENQARILGTQIRIGELRSRLTELTTKMSSGTATLEGLERVRENTSQQIKAIRDEIKGSQERIGQLSTERDSLLKEIAEKQTAYDAIYSETTEAMSDLDEKNRRISETEAQMRELHEKAIHLRSEEARSQSRIKVYSERLEDLEEKRDDLKSSISRLEESVNELSDVQRHQTDQLSALQNALERRTRRKKILEIEIKEAGRIAEIAREAFVEFEARKELLEKVRTEENALRHVEELGELGVIEGIHGRFSGLIKVDRRHERAVEAAAAGWLNSLVVNDMDVAFTCIETLRKHKLGRIKIIPMQGLSTSSQLTIPRTDGVEGRVSSLVGHNEKYGPVVSFVLGDTLLASNEKAALTASTKGFRSVTLDGDLYEAGGGVESGFYRTPLDFSSFVPTESALKALDKAVVALKEILSRRDVDIVDLDEEISETQQEITRLSETSGKLEGEIERARKSIEQAKLNIDRAENNVTSLQNLLEEEKAQIELYEKKRGEVAEKGAELQKKLTDLRRQVDPREAQERNREREALGNEIITLRQKAGEIETELSTLQSKMETVLEAGLENISTQRDRAARQISIIQKEIEQSAKEKEEIQVQIKELEETKGALSTSLLSAKGEAEKFTLEIDEIDNRLRMLEEEYEKNDHRLDELRLNLQTFQLHVGRAMEQLKALGYEEPLTEPAEQVQETEKSLRHMRSELGRIGAVNQLAQTQYEDQISRYKELSIRMNELERERTAIANFIEEIEQKKNSVFMEAFNKINGRIDGYFSKLTDGGNAALKLENPEAPFSGGVDMIVQFAGKPPILLSGASSGERSVSAVAFVFALQEFTPASFYLLDEIDAHLDAFHVERLGELLAEEAEKSQFLVVTLKPEMVSKADRIYGVYGHEGVSHLVSTTFKGAPQ